MPGYNHIFIVLMNTLFISSRANINPHMDSILFDLNWPGPSTKNDLEHPQDKLLSEGSVFVTTPDNEKYVCTLPDNIIDKNTEQEKDYTGPNEIELLTDLFDQTTCSYRIESYWSYELCHGKHLRQFHEDKELSKRLPRPKNPSQMYTKYETKKTPKLQEYFLGRLNREKAEEEFKSKFTFTDENGDRVTKVDPTQVPMQKVEGIEIPYFEMVYDDGTSCDLTKTPRKANIHYVCHLQGKGEIYELKEVSTCEYEVVVLTHLLCKHPAYEPQKEPVNHISCHSVNGSPQKPTNLEKFEQEHKQDRFNRREPPIPPHSPKPKPPPETPASTRPTEKIEATIKAPAAKPIKQTTTTVTKPKKTVTFNSPVSDQEFIQGFLSGSNCLHGGAGWWRYELCYGRQVSQYHIEKQTNEKTTILLGKWDTNTHIKWLEDNPTKKPRPLAERKHVSLYHSRGDRCDITGKARSVEVKIKCKENPSQPHAVSNYLVEPSTCEYILVVEAHIFCSMVKDTDENGIFFPPK